MKPEINSISLTEDGLEVTAVYKLTAKQRKAFENLIAAEEMAGECEALEVEFETSVRPATIAIRHRRCLLCKREGHNRQTCGREEPPPRASRPVTRTGVSRRAHIDVAKALAGRPVRPVVDLSAGAERVRCDTCGREGHATCKRRRLAIPPLPTEEVEDEGLPTDRDPAPWHRANNVPGAPLRPVFKRLLSPPPPVVTAPRVTEDPQTVALTANQWLELCRLAKAPQSPDGFLRHQVQDILAEKGLAWSAAITGRCTITDAGRKRLRRGR